MMVAEAGKDIKRTIAEIREWKKHTDSVILSHYYMPPELQVLEKDGGAVDFIGDSLGLSLEAIKVKAKNIVFCGVRFMAETAKILNQYKHVFIPDKKAGCSLASSITAEQIRIMKRTFPGIPVIAYINTYAETKAECDICCTSRNALSIAKSFDSDSLIFIPDFHMGQNLESRIYEETGKEMILWRGTCEVHEQFSRNSMLDMKSIYPDAELLLHWEVPRDSVAASFENRRGVLGSTNDILKYVGESKSKQYILASECDLGAVLKGLYPDKEFITPCIKCSYMKKISLENTLDTLKAIGTHKAKNYEIELPVAILRKSYLPLKRMLNFV